MIDGVKTRERNTLCGSYQNTARTWNNNLRWEQRRCLVAPRRNKAEVTADVPRNWLPSHASLLLLRLSTLTYKKAQALRLDCTSNAVYVYMPHTSQVSISLRWNKNREFAITSECWFRMSQFLLPTKMCLCEVFLNNVSTTSCFYKTALPVPILAATKNS